jgi:uncharacterized repeat protein (TIGR01451 family)
LKISSASPAVDAGTNYAGTLGCNIDYWGDARPMDATWDIGADESPLPALVHHFSIIHDTNAYISIWEPFIVIAQSSNNTTITASSNIGDITIDVINLGGPVIWSNGSGQGTFITNGLSGKLVYSFTNADFGTVTLYIKDNTEESVNIEIANSLVTTATDTDLEGWLHFNPLGTILDILKTGAVYYQNILFSLNPKPGYTIRFTNWYTNYGSSTADNAIIRDAIPDYLQYVASSANSVGGFVPSWSTAASPAQNYTSGNYNQTDSSAALWVRWTNASVSAYANNSLIFDTYLTNAYAGTFITNISWATSVTSPISNSSYVITVGTQYGGRFSYADDQTNYTGNATYWTMYLTNKGNLDTTYTLTTNIIDASNSSISDWNIGLNKLSVTIPMGGVSNFIVSVTPLTVTTNGAWIDFDIIAETPSTTETNYTGDNSVAYGGDIGETNDGTTASSTGGKIYQQNNTTDGFAVRLWRFGLAGDLDVVKSGAVYFQNDLLTVNPKPGYTVTYTNWYTNSGETAVQNGIIRDNIPIGMQYNAGIMQVHQAAE